MVLGPGGQLGRRREMAELRALHRRVWGDAPYERYLVAARRTRRRRRIHYGLIAGVVALALGVVWIHAAGDNADTRTRADVGSRDRERLCDRATGRAATSTHRHPGAKRERSRRKRDCRPRDRKKRPEREHDDVGERPTSPTTGPSTTASSTTASSTIPASVTTTVKPTTSTTTPHALPHTVSMRAP
jgi:hypothetical protein